MTNAADPLCFSTAYGWRVMEVGVTAGNTTSSLDPMCVRDQESSPQMSWLRTKTPWLLRLPPAGLAALGAVAAAVLMTWPLTAHVTDHILAAIYHWDAYTNAMIMGGRVDAALGRGPLSFYDNYFFAPLPNTTAFNENLFGLSLLFAPVYLASENPLLAYNVTLLSSLSLSVFFTYLLVLRLTGSGLAGFVAGVAFAFCPYVLFEIGRIQLVATQWIPACFLMLHRTLDYRRWRDVAGLWLCYLLQVGTCLYYAMFLIPLLALTGVVLMYRSQPPRALYVKLIAGGALAGGVALLMVYPYFASRGTFDLERSLAFAASYDGKLSFFANVHETNRTLRGLHHQGEMRGAHEEIAFPGFTMLALATLAIGVPVWQTARRLGLRLAVRRILRWVALCSLAVATSLVSRDMLVGAAVIGLGLWWQTKTSNKSPFSDGLSLYVGGLLLAVVMFLGLEPFQFRGEPVHGIYYYFHTYFPGFNGIRKVSRQAVMTTFLLVVVASFGSAWLLGKFNRIWQRVAACAALVAVVCLEFRSFPHPVQRVWAGETVPRAYHYLATQPVDELVASLPQNTGQRMFRGDHGLALHNYLMLYHKHRSLNGQSSWEPTVTTLVNHALSQLPSDSARRVLASLEARHLVIHGDDLAAQQRQLPQLLSGMPQYFHHGFQLGNDHVFTLRDSSDPSLVLSEVTPLPAGAVVIPASELRVSTNLDPQGAEHSLDGDPNTFWSNRRGQAPGQFYELSTTRPRQVVALEFENPWNQHHLPMAYDLAIAGTDEKWRTVVEQPLLRVPHDLVYAPKRYVFRVVLPEPQWATKVRLTLRQPVPGVPLTIYEARLYETRE